MATKIRLFALISYCWASMPNQHANEAYDTAHAYVGTLYRGSGSLQSGGYDLAEFSKTYAICINNKNMED